MSDQELESELAAYKALQESNPNVDVSALMLNALDKQKEENKIPTNKKLTAYFVSLAVPPFGLIYATKFYFSGTEDGKKAALYCVLITIGAILATTLMFNMIMSAAGPVVHQPGIDQLQQLVQ